MLNLKYYIKKVFHHFTLGALYTTKSISLILSPQSPVPSPQSPGAQTHVEKWGDFILRGCPAHEAQGDIDYICISNYSDFSMSLLSWQLQTVSGRDLSNVCVNEVYQRINTFDLCKSTIYIP